MKVFVTGATGFIGHHVVERLIRARHDVRCLIRKPSEASGKLKEAGAVLAVGDLLDRGSLLRGMSGCDWLVHVAGLYSFWERNNKVFRETNVDGTRIVMECALETGISKVIHVSSVVVFGKPADSPFTEESQVGPVRFSEYSRTKYEGDLVVWDLRNTRKLPVVVIYPCAVLGAGDPKATGKYLKALLSRRLPATVFDESVMTFVSVQDVAEAIVRAAEKQGNIGECYCVGRYQYSFREVNRMVNEISGVPLPKLHLPDALAIANATILTWISALTKRPPPWGLSIDQARVMQNGFRVDGSKVERELGITYTPIRPVIEEMVASIK